MPTLQSSSNPFLLPMTFATPLWAAYGAAATMGMAFLWMGRSNALAGFDAFMARASELPFEPQPTEAPAPDAEPFDFTEKAPELIADALPELPVVAPEVIAEPVVLPPDDLTRIVGIGPKLAAALAANGVTRFAELAGWKAKDLEAFDKLLDLKGRAIRDAWVPQARRFAEG